MIDRMDLTKILAVLAAAYPHANITQQTAEVWLEMLGDLPLDQLKAATTKLMATSKFCPSIAEVRAAALSVRSDLTEKTGEEAWGLVLDGISSWGGYRAPQFNDPLIERAVQCTARWPDLCSAQMDDMPSHRARFIAAYDSIHRRVVEGYLLPDSLKRQIAECRKDFLAGTLGGNSPQDCISEQAVKARALVAGVGETSRG